MSLLPSHRQATEFSYRPKGHPGSLCVLLVEDDEAHAELVQRAFLRHGDRFELRTAKGVADARAHTQERLPHVVLSDWKLKDGHATDLMSALPELPVVVMTSQGDEQIAVDVLKAGALDYVVKSQSAFHDLPLTVERAYRESRVEAEKARSQERLRVQYECIRLLANASTLDQGLRPALARAAEHLDAAAAELWLPAAVPGELSRVAYWTRSGAGTVTRKSTWQASEGWLGQLWFEGGDRALNQLPCDPEFLDYDCMSPPIRSACAHGISQGEERLGLLLLFGQEPAWGADPELCTFVGALAAQLAEFIRRSSLQQELIDQERLAALGATAAVFAHEVGNPLNNMYLHAQILRRRVAKLASADSALAAVDTIVSEMRRLTSLLEEFRSLSRKQPLVLASVSLAKLLRDVVSLHVEPAGNIVVHWDLQRPLPAMLGDRDKLFQAFLNLCKNAVEAMSEGGNLYIRARADARRVVLELSDDGPGLPPGLDVFQPFKTTKTSGTGLGLPIVRQIFVAHGGSIAVGSSSAGGAVFTVTLPLNADRALA